MIRFIFTITLTVLFACHQSAMCYAGGCGHLYQHHVQAVAVQPVVLYSVGDSLLIEAAVEKAFKRRESQPQPGTLQQQSQKPTSSIAAKCVRCHQGTTASGGLDLRFAVSDYHFRRSVEMLGEGIDVPEKMAGVIKSLTPQEKGQITSELMRLKPPKPEPLADEPGILQ